MTSEAVILAVIDALEAVDLPFMVVGSVATNFYGIPRSTRDADFVIQAAPPLAALVAHLGANLRVSPQASFEGVTGTLRHRIEARGTPSREKDVDDVRSVITVQGDGLDWAYVEQWCGQHGTSALLEKIRKSVEA